MIRDDIIACVVQPGLQPLLIPRLRQLPSNATRDQINTVLYQAALYANAALLIGSLATDGDGDDRHYLHSVRMYFLPTLSLVTGEDYVKKSC